MKNTLIILVAVSLTLFYSIYQKNRILAPIQEEGANIILKQMPAFKAVDFKTGEVVSKETLAQSGPQAVVVHFWGTWCAPCEAEFPSLLQLAHKFQNHSKVHFLFISVRDQWEQVNRFLKKHPPLPSNVHIALNPSGDVLTAFGTVKVPETYLFNDELFTKQKFIGPQNWSDPHFADQIFQIIKN